MSPPIRDGSGSSIGSIRLGDGSEISEVRTGAGDVVFSASPDIPTEGLLHNYDAQQLSGFADGDSVSTRVDQAGSDDLTGSGIYRDSVINGSPAIEYNSANNHVHDTVFSVSVSPSYHVYAVSVISTNGNNEVIWESNSGRGIKDAQFNGANDWFVNNGGGNLGGINYTSGDNDIVLVEFNSGPETAVRVNGADINRADVGGNGNLDGIRLARNRFDSTTFDQIIGQVLIYNPDAQGYNRSDVESFLSDRWGIVL